MREDEAAGVSPGGEEAGVDGAVAAFSRFGLLVRGVAFGEKGGLGSEEGGKCRCFSFYIGCG